MLRPVATGEIIEVCRRDQPVAAGCTMISTLGLASRAAPALRSGPRWREASIRATLTYMERMGVRQLQQNAAAAVRRARRGERVEITDRGRPVAVLVPVAHANVLDALEAAGRLVRAEGDALEIGPPIRVPRGVEAPSRRLARLRATER